MFLFWIYGALNVETYLHLLFSIFEVWVLNLYLLILAAKQGTRNGPADRTQNIHICWGLTIENKSNVSNFLKKPIHKYCKDKIVSCNIIIRCDSLLSGYLELKEIGSFIIMSVNLVLCLDVLVLSLTVPVWTLIVPVSSMSVPLWDTWLLSAAAPPAPCFRPIYCRLTQPDRI